MKGHIMKKVVVGLVLALTAAACSAPTTEPANTMVTPEPTYSCNGTLSRDSYSRN